MAVNRRDDPTVTFLFHRTQKIARISATAQSGLRHSSRVEATFQSEPGFLRRVIKRADDEIFAGMTLWSSRELGVFISETLNNLRPRNVRSRRRQDRHRTDGGDEDDYSPKKSTAGPPSKIWIGNFSSSYS